MILANEVNSTTKKVWEMLVASRLGDIITIKKLADDCPELLYAQYNYIPPIHFAVREGHVELVKYLLQQGAHDTQYKIYPFNESLETIANDRGFDEIVSLLQQYANYPSAQKYSGDNGKIIYNRTDEEKEFEQAVYDEDLEKTGTILKKHPEFVKDETFFWSEGILAFAAKENNRAMIDLLMSYGAKVPKLLKWAQFYYFERLDAAAYMMKTGMDPNTMSWQHVTLLHDMAQKGNLEKAELLIEYGAELDLIEEEYQSTPLGMAARWGQVEMVKFLMKKGADPNKASKDWAKPVEWAKKKGHEEITELLINK